VREVNQYKISSVIGLVGSRFLNELVEGLEVHFGAASATAVKRRKPRPVVFRAKIALNGRADAGWIVPKI
jgi:hypothetical protein